MNSDPTWKSIDNWYWRSWEVCIGIVAACIPALRPGYKTVLSGITAYFANRPLRRSRGFALVDSGNPSKTPADHKPESQRVAQPKTSYDSAFGAAAQAVSAEADRAKDLGAGEDGFAMKSLPGDKRTANQGIKKTTRIDVGSSADGSLGNLSLGNAEHGFENRGFL